MLSLGISSLGRYRLRTNCTRPSKIPRRAKSSMLRCVFFREGRFSRVTSRIVSDISRAARVFSSNWWGASTTTTSKVDRSVASISRTWSAETCSASSIRGGSARMQTPDECRTIRESMYSGSAFPLFRARSSRV
ncbi:MAG TPA: hypothetical protein DDX05_02280 [Deltaproteobacteria bacterium]|nr:hypothetical protein [Deltaproteobacteria bacterium]HBG72458.1 hypothetical protein [Deltaproteobacteria bacterium]